ncbi:glycoside hydrolase family 5 protein [Curtobacterium sp. ISL-83]|uniref:glycoside hydrolase family 5 protein n=1 Tax=Curtobacterium sp. ISL-83 TaxID=2819145 RepID=UPI001BE5A6BA|nr:cellulase family glycosylhydrolase [Curtobacterium sp. ISL-83]MBT2503566.1 cellulase family glycosylhydrolase [Curtobacterium sp. ISL-83]
MTGLLAVLCAGATAMALAAPATATAAPGTTTATSAHVATTASADRHHPSSALDPTQFHGVNWADPRDNYANGPVIPSGLSTADGYATTYRKSDRIIREFRHDLGADTVRLPVNPYSVGTDWWRSYRAAIDAARHDGVKVVLGYWEGNDASKDGKVDDPAAWTAMWDTLTRTYAHDPGVYFEPMNEPFGYAPADWIQVATTWVDRYTAQGLPRNRIFVSGTGYNDHVDAVCAAPALAGTYVSQHYYGFWGTHSAADWAADFTSRLGDQACSARTVLDEFGVPMTTGIDYQGSATTGNADADNSVAFLQTVTTIVRQRHLGAVYWPGLRTDDTYSLEALQGSGTHVSLRVTNQSGVDLLHWAWGAGRRAPFTVG